MLRSVFVVDDDAEFRAPAVENFVTAIFRKLAIAPENAEYRRVQAALMLLHEQRSGP